MTVKENWALLIVAKRSLDGGVHTQVVMGYHSKAAADAAAAYIDKADDHAGFLRAIVFPGPLPPEPPGPIGMT